MRRITYIICMERIPLSVIELCDEDGKLTPLYVVVDGKQYEVQKVYGSRRHAPDVACVSPVRYDCVIDGVRKTIYRDGHPSNKWFSVK